ncbi:F-box only protein 30 [Varanus komodoensis]|nr:F-box only protein 30 isoform X2 [Varanus komodoensis]XP_044279155.1 F-box only protein 30 isoform X2 [Varanus komodoensis]XP_044279165.1 F-box only protein 30 isoform X2 [Varanus komodoensis]XP_044279175.1 F-box only protein 30 isoform X2 [Varanus komodoensis]KAF7254181.1 F-box only protein 30 [Varanus komodoensis]
MEEHQHIHCVNCVSRRCMTRPEAGISCDLIGCPMVCGAVFHSCKAEEHRLLCALERVPCLNSGFGCPFIIARNKIAEHLETCPASVVCCTMEWNRWPVSYADRKSYENLSKDVDEVEQLDMALALQDQRMLLESLKVATMTSKTADPVSKSREQISVASTQDVTLANGLMTVDKESYGALYQATVETTKSLATALDILNSATRDISMLSSKLGISPCETNENVETKEQNCDRNMHKQLGYDCQDDGSMGAVGGIQLDVLGQNAQLEQNGSSDICYDTMQEYNLNMSLDNTSLCNGFYVDSAGSDTLQQSEELETSSFNQSNVANGITNASSCDETLNSYNLIPVAPPVREEIPLHSFSNGTINHVYLPRDYSDELLQRQIEQDRLRNIDVFSLIPHRTYNFLANHYLSAPKEDKAVDTSDLEITEDPMGLQGIDLITAALLFCLGDSPGGRGISDSRVIDGYRVDFGTQTFSLPSAILATNTMVGEIASASACDHANPQLSNPSPFQTLGLDLVLECVARYQTKRSMFTFVCGQLFRRNEFSSHFKNVHGDIHAGLNGWMEQRCPLAYYGCTYSQRRFCPSTQGAKIIHDRHLRSFGVQPCISTVLTEPDKRCCLGLRSDHLSNLPFEVLQHIAGFLDGFSLCQLSQVSRLMRDVCGSLLQARGMVILLWEKRMYPDGSSSWQIKEKVWRFSTAFCTVNEWKFADIVSMADHLKKCNYNAVERREEAVPLPCMCVTRELTKEGRSLRSVLKPVL